jgi:hypothetical protein
MPTPDDATAYFIQFPHPGPEHVPAEDDMPWNVGDHARKFLRGHGRCIDHDDTLGEANVVFWGEWEAPSRVVTRWRDRHGPRALHDPYWCTPPRGSRQNTDPWVFGEAFRYSNCRQLTAGHHRPSRMQQLTTISDHLRVHRETRSPAARPVPCRCALAPPPRGVTPKVP